MTLQQNS